jgi:hypothetical protein
MYMYMCRDNFVFLEYKVRLFFQNERTAPHYQSTLEATQQSISVELSLVRLRLQRESISNLLAVAKSIAAVLK